MAGGESSDLVMKFVYKGSAIEGESSTDLKLVKGPMTMGFEKGYMFEVDSFNFSAGVKETDDETAAKQAQEATDRKLAKLAADNAKLSGIVGQMGHHNANTAPGPTPPEPRTSGRGFDKWRKGEAAKYPVDIPPVRFSRGVDKASVLLLQNCIWREVYDSATLIKRKAAGSASSGEVYLRFDFDTLLMIKVDWSDDEPIQESCEFVSRAVTIHYRPQLPDGSLGAPRQGFWTMSPDKKPLTLR